MKVIGVIAAMEIGAKIVEQHYTKTSVHKLLNKNEELICTLRSGMVAQVSDELAKRTDYELVSKMKAGGFIRWVHTLKKIT